MTKFEKILCYLGFDIVISIEPFFENQRIVKRGNKYFLQKLGIVTYASDGDWEDVKQLK